MKNSKKTKSILKGASFFLATFAFCGLIALGSRFIKNDISNPGYEISTTSKVAYADEPASIDKATWGSFKTAYADEIVNVTSIVTSVEDIAEDDKGSVNVELGTNVRVDINGSVMTIYSTDGTEIYLPQNCENFFSGYTGGVEDENGVQIYYYFQKVTTMNLQYFDTSNVTNMEMMFHHCYSLKNLNLSSFDTSNVEYMDAMFKDCESLTSLDLSNFDTTNVEYMGWMFYNCGSLKLLDLSNFSTHNVKDMYGMFAGCWELRTLDISSFDLREIDDDSSYSYYGVEDMFETCHNLREIYLPRAINESHDVELPGKFHLVGDNNQYEKLNSFKYNLSTEYNKQLVVRDWPYLNKSSWENFKNNYIKDNNNIKSIIFYSSSDIDTTAEEIGDHVYANVRGSYVDVYTDLDLYITLPADCSDMFKGLDQITYIDFELCDASEVNDVSGMLESCTKLSYIYLPNFYSGTLTNMRRMFYGCESLKNIDLPAMETSNVTDMNEMFYNCKNLSTLYSLRYFDFDNVVEIDDFLYGCDKLHTIFLPKVLPETDIELGKNFVLATNHEVTGDKLSDFAVYLPTGYEIVTITVKHEVLITGENGRSMGNDVIIECYYGDEIAVDENTLTFVDISVTAQANEYPGLESIFLGWAGILDGKITGGLIYPLFDYEYIPYTLTIINGDEITTQTVYHYSEIPIDNLEDIDKETIFVGWTWEGQEEPVKDVVIQEMTSDRTLTANFARRVYTITVNVDGDIDTIEYTIDSDDITVKNPTKSGLKFDGWVDEDGNKYDELVVPAGSTGDKHFQATWKTDHTIKYVAIGVLSLAGVFLATEIFLGCLKLVRKKK